MNLFGTAYSAQQQGGIYSTYRPESNPIANAILGVLFFAVAIAAYPAKLFYRENLGERAVRIIDPFVYFIAYWEMAEWTAVGSFVLHALLLGDMSKNTLSSLSIILSLPIPSIIFLVWLFRKSYKYFKVIHLYQPINYNERVHTFYRGESLYFKNFIGKPYKNVIITQFHVQLIVEPLTTLLLGIALLFVDATLGSALIIGGICLFIDEWEVIRKRRDMILDVLDSEMDASFVEKARHLFRKLKDSDVDLATIEVGFNMQNLISNRILDNTIEALPPSIESADDDIV